MKPKIAILAALAVLGASWPLLSQQPAPVAPPLAPAPVERTADAEPAVPQPSSPSLDATDLGAWLDGYLPASIEQGKIAGAVISVVKDGQVVLVRGYGHADVAKKVPMDGNRHLVRIGSTSKLFTWTAVMQLVEQGKLDLNRDVNFYLDFKIPSRGGRAVTMNDLMTHRGGFEEGFKEVFVLDPARMIPTGQYLKGHVRPLLFTPGQIPAYSNYGTALAGHIVERISGESFDNYIDRHILAPLRMGHTTSRQPLPDHLKGDMAYGYKNVATPRYPFEIFNVAPAGSISASAADMANFMIAHLQDGRFGDTQILKPETARFMHSPSLAHPQDFDTTAHGFNYRQRNGRLVIGHGGATITFFTDMNLIPAENVGIFVGFNSRGEGDKVHAIRDGVLTDFMDRYFPAPAERDPPAVATAKAHGLEIAGIYESSRRSERNFLSMFNFLQQERVTAEEDGTIRLTSYPDKKFREVAPYRWREIGGTHQLQLGHADGSRIIVDSRENATILQAVPSIRDAQLNLSILAGSLIVLLWVLLSWPVGWRFRRLYGQPHLLSGKPLLLHRLTRAAALADLAYLFGWVMIFRPLTQIRVEFYGPSLDPLLRLLQVGAIIPIAGAVIGLWNAWLAIRSDRSWSAKVGNGLIAAAFLGILWIAWLGHLIGFNLNY